MQKGLSVDNESYNQKHSFVFRRTHKFFIIKGIHKFSTDKKIQVYKMFRPWTDKNKTKEIKKVVKNYCKFIKFVSVYTLISS